MDKHIKIVQINKGNSEFHNQTEQLKHMIENLKPMIIIINELNLNTADTISREQFPEFNLETDNLDKVDQTARTGILISKHLHYKRRRDLEYPGLSTVWIQLKYPGRKPVLIQGLYRQHQRLGKEGSKSMTSQKQRWDRLLTQWETATKEGNEIISMGDYNINSLSWDLPEAQKSPQDRAQTKLAEMLKERILNQGYTLVGNKPTRSPDNTSSRPAALDLMITNRIYKVENFQVGISSFSDHHVQSLTRRTKDIKITQKRIKIRSFKNYNVQTYKENLKNHHKYVENLYERDPNVITQNLQQMINDSLREIAPIKVIQLDNTNKTKLSEKTRTTLAMRDAAYQTTKIDPSPDNLREYRNLKNQANKEVNIEKWKRSVASLQAENGSNTNKWKKFKYSQDKKSSRRLKSSLKEKITMCPL